MLFHWQACGGLILEARNRKGHGSCQAQFWAFSMVVAATAVCSGLACYFRLVAFTDLYLRACINNGVFLTRVSVIDFEAFYLIRQRELGNRLALYNESGESQRNRHFGRVALVCYQHIGDGLTKA